MMEETVLFSDHELLLSLTSESFSIDDESVWSSEAKSFQGSNLEIKEKKNKKKKKKCKGGSESPKRILAFNSSEWLKLDENKADSKKCAIVKTLSKCATFPTHTPVSVEAVCVGTQHSEDSEGSEEFDIQSLCMFPEDKTSMLMHCCSLPPKSALRGGYEELGLGPRPKLHVKWAPNVREPPSSSMSHTVNHKHSKKKDFLRGRKGRSSHDDLYKKQERRNSHKAKRNSDSGVPRICGVSYNVTPGSDVKEGAKGEALKLSERIPGECEVMLSTEVLEQETTELESDTAGRNDVNCKLGPGSGKCFGLGDAKSALLKSCVVDRFQYSNDAKCSESLHGIGGIQCKFVYGEAM